MVDGVPRDSSSSSVAAVTGRTFDVGQGGDILKLLNFIRQGPFDQIEKSQLRDQVLDFANSKDPKQLHEVADLLAEMGDVIMYEGAALAEVSSLSSTAETGVTEESAGPFAPAAVQAVEKKSATSAIGRSRRAPKFVPVSKVSTAAEHTPIKASAPKSEPEPSEKPTTPKIPQTDQSAMPMKSAVEDLIAKAPSTPKIDTSADADRVRKVKPVDVSGEPSVATPSTAPTPPSAESASQAPVSMEASPILERIREIKKTVNEQVGNPVNLIDVDNEAGREYMNALLGAMRVSTGGSSDEVTLAMDRLEKAFAAVEPLFVHVKEGKEQPSMAPEHTEVRAPVSGYAAEADVAQEVAASLSKAVESTPENSTDELTSAAMNLTPEVVPSSTPTPSSEVPQPSTPPVQSVPAVDTAAPVVTPPAPAPAGSSLADKLRAARSAGAAAAAEAEAEASMTPSDPLQASEVSAGLEQLLSEWKLFKSSGFFGTGPHGTSHPLYKTLAQLPMAAVVSGRFEGVTPEIKQSITDYMNGWRYEHGIVHEMGENFEHYLRRVIRGILDRRNGPNQA